MKTLQILALGLAVLMAGGEIARRAGTPTFIPLALDELAVCAALLWAAWRARRDEAPPMIAAWAGYCGLVAGLLAENADYLIHGREKSGAVFYTVTLAVMLAVGLWAVARGVRLARRREGGSRPGES